MSYSEISNPHVKQIVTTLPNFLRNWSLAIVITTLMACLILIQLITFTSIIKIPVATNPSDLQVPGKKQNIIVLTASISGDQKNAGLFSKECALEFYNFVPIFHGKIVEVLPTKSKNVYQIKLALNTIAGLPAIKNANRSLNGMISINNRRETIANKIVTGFRADL